MSHKPLKVVAATKCFPNVCIIDTTCFDECFLLLETSYNRHIAALFETNILKEVCILYLLSPQYHRNSANTKGPKSNFYFLNVFNKI